MCVGSQEEYKSIQHPIWNPSSCYSNHLQLRVMSVLLICMLWWSQLITQISGSNSDTLSTMFRCLVCSSFCYRDVQRTLEYTKFRRGEIERIYDRHCTIFILTVLIICILVVCAFLLKTGMHHAKWLSILKCRRFDSLFAVVPLVEDTVADGILF